MCGGPRPGGRPDGGAGPARVSPGAGAAGAVPVVLDGLRSEKAGSEQPQALCVVARGQEEGQMVELGQRVFHLALGRPVQFPLFSTASDRKRRAVSNPRHYVWWPAARRKARWWSWASACFTWRWGGRCSSRCSRRPPIGKGGQ